MGLVKGFVFTVNRRAVLAALAIGVSVSYALVAGAAVGGLQDAQDVLADDLHETRLLAVDPDGETVPHAAIDPPPDTAIARYIVDEHTLYTARAGDAPTTNTTIATASPNGPYENGQTIQLPTTNVTVQTSDPLPGAQNSWLGVAPSLFDDEQGPPEDQAHILVYDEPTQELQETLQSQGLTVMEAPGAFPYYATGASQLVSAVHVTVLASALVVGLLTSTVTNLELRAKRRSFATLQAYAENRFVQKLVAARGATLLAAGHLVGLTLTFGFLFLLQRANVATLTLTPTFTTIALAATLGGGLLALALPVREAGKPLTARDLTPDPPPKLPRLLRLTIARWRTLIPLAIAAAVLAASLGVVFGAVDMPNQVFGTDDANVIADVTNNPLRGTAPTFLGLHMGKTDGYDGSSPEIYAPTTLNGEPLMARGVHWETLRTLDPIHITQGHAPQDADHAIIGHRAANTHDLAPGDTLHLPSAYTPTLIPITITGIAHAPGLLADEILLPLPTAREAADLPPDAVNLIRYRTDATLTEPPQRPTGIQITNLDVQPENPLPHQTANAHLDLVNFDTTTQQRQLTLTANGQPVSDAWVTLPPQTATTHTLPFRVPQTPTLTLAINPSQTVETGEAAYRIDAPPAVTTGRTLTATVTTPQGEPAQDVTLTLDEETATTDAQGQAQLPARNIGNRTLHAEGPDGAGATTLVVVNPGDLNRGVITIRSLTGPSTTTGSWEATAHVENTGGALFDGTFTVPVNGTPTNATEIRLLSGQTGRATFTLDLPQGTHTIGPPDAQATVTVTESQRSTGDPSDDGEDEDPGEDPDDGDDGGASDPGGSGDEADIEALLERRAQAQQSGSSGEDMAPLDAFLAETFENFDAAVTVVTIATVLHAGLIGLVAVRRDVEENAGTVGTLAGVGADRSALRGYVVREFLLVGALAAVIGTVVGLGVVLLAAWMGWIGGFGYALVPRSGVGFAARLVVVSLGVSLLAGVLAVERVRGRSMQALLSQGPSRQDRPPLGALIGGRDR